MSAGPASPHADRSVLSILQVSPSASGGGAESVAKALHREYGRRGHDAWLGVGKHPDPSERIVRLDAGHGAWSSFWWRRYFRYLDQERPRAALATRTFVTPAAILDQLRGIEDFRFPQTRRLLELTPRSPDIVQLHNLHGGYFDLRALRSLSRAVEVVLSPHDAWLGTGHVAHSLDCERWRTGCGDCPYLSLYPAIRRDASHANWLRKQGIFVASRLRVATPSRWLADRLRESMLAAGVVEWRVIPHGIDLNRFSPGNRNDARRALGLPPDSLILVTSGRSLKTNPWKDFPTLKEALTRIQEPTLVLALGDHGTNETYGHAEVRHVPDVPEDQIAAYLHAADLYVHPARADTFPLSILEALATGTPVVATRTGGIPEQLADGQTGLLVSQGDSGELSAALNRVLGDEELRRRFGDAAAADARKRFDLSTEVDAYVGWFQELVEARSERD